VAESTRFLTRKARDFQRLVPGPEHELVECMRYALLLTLLLLAGFGCALPTDTSETVALEDADDENRVFDTGDTQIDAVSPEFSFVLDADGPQVILGHVWSGDGIAVGEPTFIRPPWLTDELAVRRDVDVDALPVELLMRQGEPFVAPAADGGTCVGYLGELSIVRLVMGYNLGDLAEMPPEAYDELYDDERVGPPTSLELNDPTLIWKAAERRTYLTARWETDDECEIGDWGAHPEHAPVHFAPIDAAPFEAEAQRQLRARPEYPEMQAEYDEFRQDGDAWWTEAWPAGPWDEEHFRARAFEAPDGRRIVLGWAEQSDGDCAGGPGYLHLLFDVTDDGELVLREKLNGIPSTRAELRSLLESDDGSLMFLTDRTLQSVFEPELLQDVLPVQIGCGC